MASKHTGIRHKNPWHAYIILASIAVILAVAVYALSYTADKNAKKAAFNPACESEEAIIQANNESSVAVNPTYYSSEQKAGSAPVPFNAEIVITRKDPVAKGSCSWFANVNLRNRSEKATGPVSVTLRFSDGTECKLTPFKSFRVRHPLIPVEVSPATTSVAKGSSTALTFFGDDKFQNKNKRPIVAIIKCSAGTFTADFEE